MVYKTVKVKKYSDVIEEFVAADEITPGMLLELDSNGEVAPHSEAGGSAYPLFALEDELQGKGIDDNYAADDQVQVWLPGRGDIVNAIAGAEITAGDFLVSAGAGKLKPAGSGVSVDITGTVTGADATLSDLALTLEEVADDPAGGYTGSGMGKLTATLTGTAAGTDSVVVHAHSIVGQALTAANSGKRVAVRIV